MMLVRAFWRCTSVEIVVTIFVNHRHRHRRRRHHREDFDSLLHAKLMESISTSLETVTENSEDTLDQVQVEELVTWQCKASHISHSRVIVTRKLRRCGAEQENICGRQRRPLQIQWKTNDNVSCIIIINILIYNYNKRIIIIIIIYNYFLDS